MMTGAFPSGLITASAMLTLAGGLAVVLFQRCGISSARLRQMICLGVLLQGLMFFRAPIELAWLAPSPAPPIDAANLSAASLAPSYPFETATHAGETSLQQTRLDHTLSRDSDTSLLRSPLRLDTLGTLAMGMWFAGTLAAISRGLIRYRRLCHMVRRLPLADDDWREPWQQLCRRFHLPPPPMRISESAGPMLVRTVGGYELVIPKRFWLTLSHAQRDAVLLHELAHLRRRDVWRQLFVQLVAAIHWWNPTLWWCVRRYEEATEWACDETLLEHDTSAANALAKTLVQLVEFSQSTEADRRLVYRGFGVQSMATPPLTQRVRRLIHPPQSRDSVMKRLTVTLLAGFLLLISLVQFRLVAAPPADDSNATSATLQVVPVEVKAKLDEIAARLDPDDSTTAQLKSLFGSESGRIALTGLLEQLRGQSMDSARSEAIPRFVETHFQSAADGTLSLREEHRDVAKTWISQANQLVDAADAITERLASIAKRLDGSDEVHQLAKRMLTDEHIAFALMLQEFNGRSDPIDLYLDKAMAKILVRRDDRMIVIPTLGDEGERKLSQLEMATEIYERLRSELPAFADEFSSVDERHRRLTSAIKGNAAAAIFAAHLADDGAASTTAAVDGLFEKLEQVSRDTADGLVIQDEEAWTKINEIIDLSERAATRADRVQFRLNQLAKSLDTQDPMTQRFASVIRSGVISYRLAAEIPYADVDLGKQIETALSGALEPSGENGLRIRPESIDEVSERCEQWLSTCRTVRRYLTRIESVRQRIADPVLAKALEGPARMLLLAEVKRHAEQHRVDTMKLLVDELFLEDESNHELTVRADRAQWVRDLADRAQKLERELSNNDF